MAKPLTDLFCIREPYCDYPIAIRVAMDDGTIQTYALENRTDYQFQKVMDCLHRMNVGYQYRPRRKNRAYRGSGKHGK